MLYAWAWASAWAWARQYQWRRQTYHYYYYYYRYLNIYGVRATHTHTHIPKGWFGRRWIQPKAKNIHIKWNLFYFWINIDYEFILFISYVRCVRHCPAAATVIIIIIVAVFVVFVDPVVVVGKYLFWIILVVGTILEMRKMVNTHREREGERKGAHCQIVRWAKKERVSERKKKRKNKVDNGIHCLLFRK